MTATCAATRLGELDLAPLVRVAWDATAQDVAQEMSARRCSAVVIGSGESIVTEHDIVRAVASRRPPDWPVRFMADGEAFSIDDGRRRGRHW
jgi:signal-transduction protein with cAMP-binding, CBS, and nucleotidyltransferase domain